MCKATRESRRRPVARVVPSICTAAFSAAESESMVNINGAVKPRNKGPRGGSQSRSQTPQCERKRRVASLLGIKLDVYASLLRRLWYCAGRSPLHKPRLYRTVVLACLHSRSVQMPCVGSTYVNRCRRSYGWRQVHKQLAFPGVRPQLGQNWRTKPDLPRLKHSFNGQTVCGWFAEVQVATEHFRQAAGPQPLLPPRPPRLPRPPRPRWDIPFVGQQCPDPPLASPPQPPYAPPLYTLPKSPAPLEKPPPPKPPLTWCVCVGGG